MQTDSSGESVKRRIRQAANPSSGESVKRRIRQAANPSSQTKRTKKPCFFKFLQLEPVFQRLASKQVQAERHITNG
jgi:hypothetical protein